MKIRNCSRCGGDHDNVETMELAQPFAPPECAPIVWTRWAPCPTNGQPIMVAVTEDADIGAEIPSGEESFAAALPVVYQVFCERRVDARDSGLTELSAFESTVREFFGKWKPT